MFRQKISKFLYKLLTFLEKESRIGNLTVSVSDKEVPNLGDCPITLRLYKAGGGLIVQTICYGSTNTAYTVNSGPSSSLFIIESGKNIGEELEKIILMTSLSQ